MNYIEKTRHLKKLDEEDMKTGYSSIYHIDIRCRKSCWQPNELELLLKPYPYVPKEYIDFIKEFDNLGLSFTTFYGSKAGDVISLAEEIEYWRQYLKEDYFPFGKDVDGSVFTINRNKEIILFWREDFECKDPIKVANSFEEFVGECLMGKRYHEEADIENDSYYDLLKSLGWV